MTGAKEYAPVPRAADRILRSARAARAYARGGTASGFVAHVPEQVDVRAIRAGLGLSQQEFALRFGFSVAAVRDWEQCRRQPDPAARVLLTVIAAEPEAVDRALAQAARRLDLAPAGTAGTTRGRRILKRETGIPAAPAGPDPSLPLA
jgi:putative transcriptional regulator